MFGAKHKGVLCGIAAAVFYGTNPFGALPLYEEGVNTSSVLSYRFGFAALLLGVIMLVRRQSFAVSLREARVLLSLGLLFAVSSVSLYMSFLHMDAGIASTILFVYPVMVAVIMALFFGERVTLSTVSAIVLSLLGVVLLYRGGGGSSLSVVGLSLVLVSALSYAVYMVVVNRSCEGISSMKLTFYVLLTCVASLFVYSCVVPGQSLMAPPSPRAWFYALWLGVVPSVLSLVLTAVAVQLVGATATAILGALEPLTAVVIGIAVFGEELTGRLVVGLVLILTAVSIVILGKQKRVGDVGRGLRLFGRRMLRHRHA